MSVKVNVFVLWSTASKCRQSLYWETFCEAKAPTALDQSIYDMVPLLKRPIVVIVGTLVFLLPSLELCLTNVYFLFAKKMFILWGATDSWLCWCCEVWSLQWSVKGSIESHFIHQDTLKGELRFLEHGCKNTDFLSRVWSSVRRNLLSVSKHLKLLNALNGTFTYWPL